MKLSINQKEIIRLMQDEWVGEYAIVNSESAYLTKSGFLKRKYNFRNFTKLMEFGLITSYRYNFAVRRYTLTDSGKNFKVN